MSRIEFLSKLPFVYRLNFYLQPHIFFSNTFFSTRLNYTSISQLKSKEKQKIHSQESQNFSSSLLNLQFYKSGLCFSTKSDKTSDQSQDKNLVASSKEDGIKFSDLSTSQKAKQVSSDTFYTGIVIAGIALTVYIFFSLGMELFSTQTPNGLYNLAYKKAIKHDRVLTTLGTPIKAYGEMTRRGRRQHVRSSEYTLDDGKKKVMNIEFHLEGSSKKATVLAESVAVNGGKYELKYVVMRVDTYPHEVVTILDERDQ